MVAHDCLVLLTTHFIGFPVLRFDHLMCEKIARKESKAVFFAVVRIVVVGGWNWKENV